MSPCPIVPSRPTGCTSYTRTFPLMAGCALWNGAARTTSGRFELKSPSAFSTSTWPMVPPVDTGTVRR